MMHCIAKSLYMTAASPRVGVIVLMFMLTAGAGADVAPIDRDGVQELFDHFAAG